MQLEPAEPLLQYPPTHKQQNSFSSTEAPSIPTAQPKSPEQRHCDCSPENLPGSSFVAPSRLQIPRSGMETVPLNSDRQAMPSRQSVFVHSHHRCFRISAPALPAVTQRSMTCSSEKSFCIWPNGTQPPVSAAPVTGSALPYPSACGVPATRSCPPATSSVTHS